MRCTCDVSSEGPHAPYLRIWVVQSCLQLAAMTFGAMLFQHGAYGFAGINQRKHEHKYRQKQTYVCVYIYIYMYVCVGIYIYV